MACKGDVKRVYRRDIAQILLEEGDYRCCIAVGRDPNRVSCLNVGAERLHLLRAGGRSSLKKGRLN